MNQLLAEFLQSTAAGLDGVWAEEHLAVLEEGRTKLGPALARYQPLVSALGACELPEDLSFPDLLRTADELSRQAAKRVQTAEVVGAYARARQLAEAWREAQSGRQANARAATCGGSRKPEIFYASEEDGQVQWLFCDGMRAVQTPKGTEIVAIDPKKAKAPKKPKVHLDAVAAYPAELILRAPKKPARPEEKVAKPDDTFDLNAPLDDPG